MTLSNPTTDSDCFREKYSAKRQSSQEGSSLLKVTFFLCLEVEGINASSGSFSIDPRLVALDL
jgi:hypothetical protein